MFHIYLMKDYEEAEVKKRKNDPRFVNTILVFYGSKDSERYAIWFGHRPGVKCSWLSRFQYTNLIEDLPSDKKRCYNIVTGEERVTAESIINKMEPNERAEFLDKFKIKRCVFKVFGMSCELHNEVLYIESYKFTKGVYHLLLNFNNFLLLQGFSLPAKMTILNRINEELNQAGYSLSIDEKANCKRLILLKV